MDFIHRFLTTNLRRRFLLVNGAFLLGSALLLGLFLLIQVRSELQGEYEKRGRTLSRVLAAETWNGTVHGGESSASHAASHDNHLKDLVSTLVQEEDVIFAAIQDLDGEILVSARGESYPGEPLTADDLVPSDQNDSAALYFTRMVCVDHEPEGGTFDRAAHFQCKPLARVTVGLCSKAMLSTLEAAFWKSVFIAFGCSLIGLVAIWFVTRWTFAPLLRMSEAARKIARGDLTARVAADSRDEIGTLARAFNEMAWSLADSQEELARRNGELQLVASEKERLYKNAQVRATRLQVMNELAKAIASSLETDEIYDHVHRQLSRLLNYEYLTIQRFIPEEQAFRRDFMWVDRPVEGIEVGQTIKSENSPIRRVQRTKMPLSLPDFEKDPILAGGWLNKAGFQSGFIVPIVAHDGFLGILGLACRRKNAFARMEVATVFAIADTLAVVLKNAQLYQKLQISVDELTDTQSRLAKSENVRKAEKLRTVGQMASGIAHNFNNVMSAIIGRVQLLKLKMAQEQVGLEEMGDSLTVIERAALDGAETVRRLQEFSRGQKVNQFEKTELNGLVQSVIEITRPRWKDQPEQNGIHIGVKTRFGELPSVACIPSQLREVLTNMIFNSVDAMPAGGTILIETESDEKMAILRFSDTGVGMTAEVRERAFDPFYSTKGVKGSGLGLSTVYGIIERHAGEIKIESELGAGSTFTIRLPLAKRSTPRGTVEGMMSSTPWRILIGDDEPNVRDAFGDLLRMLGHDVVLAHDGTSTIKTFQTGGFDLVFTDLGMPDLTGWEVAEAIREIDQEIPIVLATGWGSEIDEESAHARGITRVLAKPFTVQKISSLIAELQALRNAA